MEETLFKLARAITGTDTVSSEGGTITYRITSLKRKLVNGKVAVYTKPGSTWILEGSFIVPSAGGTVSI